MSDLFLVPHCSSAVFVMDCSYSLYRGAIRECSGIICRESLEPVALCQRDDGKRDRSDRGFRSGRAHGDLMGCLRFRTAPGRERVDRVCSHVPFV